MSRIRAVAPDWAGMWARDSGLMLGSQVLATVATSALAIVVARSLGPADFGIFAGFLALSWALVLLVDLGMGSWLLRELSNARGNQPTERTDGYSVHALVVGCLTLVAALGTAVLAVAVVVAIVLGTGTQLTIVLAGLFGYTAGLAASGVVEATFRAKRELGIVASIIILEKLALLGLVATALWWDLGLEGVSAGYLAAAAIRLVTGLALARRRGEISWKRPSVQVAVYVARSSFPLAVNTGMTWTLVRLDPAVVGLLSATAAGFFTVGDRIVGALLIVPAVAATTLFPHLAQDVDVRASARRAAGLLGMVGVAGAVLGVVLAPLLVPALFGDEFGRATHVVQIMVCALPFMFASPALIAGLNSLGLERSVMPFTVFTVLGGTGLIVAGQLTLGVEGAAGAYVVRQVCLTGALLALLASTRARPSRARRVEPLAARKP